MNDLLRQLIGVAPGLAAGLRGNGHGMQAFLESYQRTNALLDQQARQQQADRMTLEDRQRAIAQQQTTAARLAESDRMAAEDRSRRRAIETIGVGDQLAKVGGLQDSPQGAESAIDALYQMLAPSFGGVEALGGIRDAAIGQARQTITARQQRQVSEFVEQALKVDHVANNPDSDPVIHNLPDHIVKIVGTPVAKLSDLQKFAQLPVGKPVRPPSAEVSMQTKDLLGPDGKPHTYNFNPKTGEYTQAQGVSPIPPKTGADGGLSPNQEALLTEKLAKEWTNATSSQREMRRQFGIMETGLKRFQQGDKNGGSQAVLVTFQKILDPTSVVRESEYARSADGVSMLSRLQGYADKLQAGGAGVPEADLTAMVDTAREMLAQMGSYSTQQRSRLDAMAKKYRIDPVLVFGTEPSMPQQTPPEAPMTPVPSHRTAPKPAPVLKERRRFGDVLGEWDGSQWVEVKVVK